MAASSPDQPGSLLAGKYRVERSLGRGGMGSVVAARHEQLGQRVAVKFLLPELCDQEALVTRFVREARAAVQITSEHVARVIDVGTLDGGAPYMVMEYLEGHDLSEELVKRGKLSVPEAVDYVLQACEAVAEAHRLGIVHRDLKPGNLFLTHRADGSPLVKVLDFGISKLTQTDATTTEASLTKTQTMLGSPLYASPEQLRDPRHVDQRTDVWALGTILYELISGQTPFNAETLTGLLAVIVADPPTPLSSHIQGGVPQDLEAVVDRCLAKDRDQRYGNVAELAWALVPFAPTAARISAERITRVLGSPLDSPSAAAAEGRSSLKSGESSPHASTTEPVSTEALTEGTVERRGVPRSVLWVSGAAAGVLIGVTAWALHRHAASADAASSAPLAASVAPEPAATAPGVAPATAEPVLVPAPSASAASTGEKADAGAPHTAAKLHAKPQIKAKSRHRVARRPRPRPRPQSGRAPAKPAYDPLAGRR